MRNPAEMTDKELQEELTQHFTRHGRQVEIQETQKWRLEQRITELEKERHTVDPCDVCYTNSWEPCDASDEDAIQMAGEWVACACCNSKRIALIWKERAEALKAENTELRKALVKYGRHMRGCLRRRYTGEYGLCFCGFKAALAPRNTEPESRDTTEVVDAGEDTTEEDGGEG